MMVKSFNRGQHPSFMMPFLLGTCFGFFMTSFVFIHLGMLQRLQKMPSGPMLSSTSTSSSPSPSENNGWKQIHVFVGDAPLKQLAQETTLPHDFFFANQWFSQVQQDYVVSRLLKGKKDGYFVDLAANDAVKISNTYALERSFGWKGLAIEPNSIYWSGLAYRSCDVVAAVVGSKRGEERTFHFPKRLPARGGLVGSKFDNKAKDKSPQEYQEKSTVTLSEVFQRFNTPAVIDYLSLDVEGAEEVIMEHFPFDDYRFNVMTVERPSKRLQHILNNKGYIQLKQLKDWGETLWIHQTAEALIDRKALDIDTEHYKYTEKSKA